MRQMRRASSISKKLREVLIRLKTNPEALKDLVLLIGTRLYKEAFRSLKDSMEAESATNHALYKLASRAGFYKENRPPLPYVISVLRNHCRDIWRSRRKKIRPNHIGDDTELYISPANYSEELVLYMALNKEEFRIAKKICLDRISPEELEESEGVSQETSLEILKKLKKALTS